MNSSRSLMALLALCVCARTWAVDPTPPLPDPKQQERYLALTHELRCVQCQNEAIADSPVEVAAELRREVREKIIAGQSDEQIIDGLVSRYSDFILFKPRWTARNALLWLAPGIMLLIGAFVGWRVLASRQKLLASDDSRVDEETPV
jgi:cytochrome c-type biogenesis protein CcmH